MPSRRNRLFCALTVFALCLGLIRARAQRQTAPPTTSTPGTPNSTTAPAAGAKAADDDDDDDDDDKADAGKDAKGKKAKKEKPQLVSAAVAADPANAKLLNPPDEEEMKAKGETWKGEYAIDRDGKPLLGPDGKMLPARYDKKGKLIKTKYKKPKTHPISIISGTLTVDGWTSKAHLNYDIPDLRYIYISAPTIGTVLVSQTAFPGSDEQKGAFQDKTLTVKVGDHELQLASNSNLLGKKKQSAWVKVDAAYLEDPRIPNMGFGNETAAPYIWPGAKKEKYTGGISQAPALPVDMRPKLAEEVCKEAGKTKCKPVAQPIHIQGAVASTAARKPSAKPVLAAPAVDDVVLTTSPPPLQAPTPPLAIPGEISAAPVEVTAPPAGAKSAPLDDTVLTETPPPNPAKTTGSAKVRARAKK